jgi:uncharacterized repeat protein (TIGR03803 family)
MLRTFLGGVLLASAIATVGSAQPVPPDTINTLTSFTGVNGANPLEDLVLSGNTLYGTTSTAGTYPNNAAGPTVFSLPVTGGTPTILATLAHESTSLPSGGISLFNGTLYGTNPYEYPGVYSVPVTGGSPTPLVTSMLAQATLTVSADGSTLYGVSGSGFGDVFSVPASGGTPTVLGSFNGVNGNFPLSVGHLVQWGNMLYGTTRFGGVGDPSGSGPGVVFSVPITGGTPTVLATLGPSSTDENDPISGLTISADGTTLYGTCYAGGTSFPGPLDDGGAVFSVPTSGGTPMVLGWFTGLNGEDPAGDLVLSGDTLYGTTAFGGRYSDGVVFSIPVTGGTPTALAWFNGTNGQDPQAGLVMSGNTLYGTTSLGGANSDGTVFSVTVPEPVSAGWLGLGVMVLTKRRRKPSKISGVAPHLG